MTNWCPLIVSTRSFAILDTFVTPGTGIDAYLFRSGDVISLLSSFDSFCVIDLFAYFLDEEFWLSVAVYAWPKFWLLLRLCFPDFDSVFLAKRCASTPKMLAWRPV